MPNPYFRFKQFSVSQDRSAMKVTTDACLFGAWVAGYLRSHGTEFYGKNILDIGTGTGLLSLMLAQAVPNRIDAVELDTDTSKQATENFSASPWSSRLRAICVDARHYVPTHPYGVIISNPPFYEREIESDNPKRNLAHHSHQLSFRELLDTVNRLLHAEGCCFLLIPAKRRSELVPLIKASGFSIWQEVRVKPTAQASIFRVMLAIDRKKHERLPDMEWSITDETGQYTSPFSSLLSEYYLYL